MQQIIGFLSLAIGYICSIAGASQSSQIEPKECEIEPIRVSYFVEPRISSDSLAKIYAVWTRGERVNSHCDSLRRKLRHGHTSAIDFVGNYAYAAREVEATCGLPAEIVLAIAMYESGRGQSRLAIEGRNFFGMKIGGCDTCLSILLDGSVWRAYNDTRGSFDDFASEMRACHSEVRTPEEFAATGWGGAGEATKRSYAKNIQKIIERYNLEGLYER